VRRLGDDGKTGVPQLQGLLPISVPFTGLFSLPVTLPPVTVGGIVVTLVVIAWVLLAVLGSNCVAVTVPLFTMLPDAVAFTVIDGCQVPLGQAAPACNSQYRCCCCRFHLRR